MVRGPEARDVEHAGLDEAVEKYEVVSYFVLVLHDEVVVPDRAQDALESVPVRGSGRGHERRDAVGVYLVGAAFRVDLETAPVYSEVETWHERRA